MVRRLHLLVFVLFFVSAEPTFGVGLFRHRRVRCPGPVTCEKPCGCKALRASECFCIQYLIWDVPGTAVDYWHVLYYPDGCGGDEVEHYEDDLYYSYWESLPQQCSGAMYHRCIGQAFGCDAVPVVPGYSSIHPSTPISLPDQSHAADVLKAGFDSARVACADPFEFYKIPKSKMTHIPDDTQAAKDTYVIVGKLPMPSGSTPLNVSPAGIPCFGLEMDYKSGEPFVELKNETCQHATVRHSGDKQIRIIFQGTDGKNRVATIWLK
jgi:hypothetical protein